MKYKFNLLFFTIYFYFNNIIINSNNNLLKFRDYYRRKRINYLINQII